MNEIRLIATDLDGTIIGRTEEYHIYGEFRDKIDDLRYKHGATWAVCTGRSLSSFKHFFGPLFLIGIRPDFVIARHAYIYSLGRYGYTPHWVWNFSIRHMLWSDRRHISRAIRQWYIDILRNFPAVSTVERGRDRLCVRFRAEESAAEAAEMLRKETASFKHMKVFKYSREVDLRSIPFTKGLAVSELARHLEIARENILTVGDGHNDISMLDGSYAGLVGCPGNAEPEVAEVVHKAGGHIAGGRSLSGVMEVIDAFQTGLVCSNLPKWWRDPSETQNPWTQKVSRHGRHGKKRKRGTVLLIPVVAYIALLAFASFDLIPFAGIIMKPYTSLVGLLGRVMSWWYAL